MKTRAAGAVAVRARPVAACDQRSEKLQVRGPKRFLFCARKPVEKGKSKWHRVCRYDGKCDRRSEMIRFGTDASPVSFLGLRTLDGKSSENILVSVRLSRSVFSGST
ncbi:hypothetical protein EVAR_32972_1 [Eumeta japonica]|uniref:Uncharacterized protein n=1 Tax=Eumeta variegata TaxID=151549 RepID=A0A4C1WXX5_EUMVA|nr:hypothetical protein EVAR_32972_1 [Eumeta japonica]